MQTHLEEDTSPPVASVTPALPDTGVWGGRLAFWADRGEFWGRLSAILLILNCLSLKVILTKTWHILTPFRTVTKRYKH